MKTSRLSSPKLTAALLNSAMRGRAFPRHLAWIFIAGIAGLSVGVGLAKTPRHGEVVATESAVLEAVNNAGHSVGRRSDAAASADTVASDIPYLLVLGVVQDAGFPQAGCYEPHCLPGWQTPGKQRGAVSLGLVTQNKKYLFEATPNPLPRVRARE